MTESIFPYQKGGKMKITDEILEALECAIRDSGSIYKLAKELGISHSTIFFWKTGKTSSINRQLWSSCLRKKLRPYLEKKDPSDPEKCVCEKKIAYGNRPKSFPVIGFKKLAFFDPYIKSTSAFVQEHSLGQFFFSSVGSPLAFALRMEENGVNEVFTENSTLLVESGRPPQPGEIVVAKLKNETSAAFYIFKSDGAQYSLEPYYSRDTHPVCWESSISSSRILEWVFPVLEACLKFSR